jgi:hypothetical protein
MGKHYSLVQELCPEISVGILQKRERAGEPALSGLDRLKFRS